MTIRSKLTRKQWLCAMKNKMDPPLSFWGERFSGLFLRPFFRVTYHAGYEWNRRITNERNTAIGYVLESESGCTVRCIRTKGILYPSAFILYWAMFFALFCIKAFLSGFPEAPTLWHAAGISFLIMAVVAPLNAFVESFTHRSEEGQCFLTAALIDPADPFAYLNHQRKL